MVDRVLINKQGFFVSKPGYDVKTANVMQMAFSSDHPIPRLILQDTVTSSPTSGPAPSPATRNCAIETVTTVKYPKPLAKIPFVAAIAKATSWKLPLSNDKAQLAREPVAHVYS